MEGWQLLSVSFDSSQSNTAKIMIRLRNLNEQIGKSEMISNMIWNDQNPFKQDIYLGASCNYQDRRYEHGGMFTISRLYIWKSMANVQSSSDSVFDKFFFRQNGVATPICIGAIPCNYCIVNYPMPISYSVQLTCTLDNPQDSLYYIARWDFDEDPGDNQYIKDLSVYQRHLMKGDPNEIESYEPYRLFGQGYLFQGIKSLYTTSAPQLNMLPQFTIEMWLRKYQDYQYSGSNPFITPIEISDLQYGNTQFKMMLSESSRQVYLYFENQHNFQFNFPGLFNSTRWYFVSVSIATYYNVFYQYGYYIHGKIQVDKNVTKLIDRDNNPYLSFQRESKMKFSYERSVAYKYLRIYGYSKIENETKYDIADSSQCSNIGNQPPCLFCPGSIKKCISICNESQYGDNCDKCHPFCGNCKGPLKSDCTICPRNVTPSMITYSETFGNCSCISGYYYNITYDTCEQCDSNCRTCFGPTQSQCMSCAPSKIFYPNTTCVNSCSDPLVVQGSINGFYMQVEYLGGNLQQICLKCHPFCTQCFGGLSTQCSKCLFGYLLQGTSCIDSCPDGKYPDFANSACSVCNIQCKTCNGPSFSNCLTCKSPSDYQQNGICQAKCDDGYYPDSNRICQVCNVACDKCTNKFTSTCSQCSLGYFLQWQSSTCQDNCPAGYYGDDVTNSCLICHYSCKACSGYGPDTCTICAEGYLRRGAFCVEQCANSEYIVNGQCVSCDSKCSTCYGTGDDQCYSCNENILTTIGYFKFGTSCLVSCPLGYFQDNILKTCIKCNPRCLTCLSEAFCTSCIDGPYQLNNGECTFFTCLDTQYRVIKPQIACYECDQSCLTCQGKSQFDCISCRPKNLLVAQQCLTCYEQPGMTEPVDDSINGCVEICGDGFNYGYYKCDDGNMINGDGCSSTCFIEEGFNCTAGTKTSPSICMDNRNPTPTISFVTVSNLLIIQFDEEVSLKEELNTNNLLITINGQQGPYKFDWQLQDQYKTSEPVQIIGIQLMFYQSLKGDQKEQVQIEFQNTNTYQDATGNGMVTYSIKAYLNKYDYIDPETKAKLESAGDTSMLATFGAVAINLAISLVFGGSISAMWTMVNTIQLISLLPLCNINYPAISVLVFQKMLGSHGESTIIPNLFYDKLVGRSNSQIQIEPPLNTRFLVYGWPISNFLYLSGRKILIWTLIIFAYPLVWYMKRRYADKHKICRLWKKVEQKFRYTLLLRGVIMSYVSMYLAFILGIFQMNLTTMENTISAFAAIAFGIILTYLPILLMNILQRNYEKIKTEKFMLCYSTVVKEVDLSHPIRYMYYPVFLLRRALFAISLVLFANSPFNQIIFMSVTSGVMIIYVVIIRPQKDKVMIVMTALGEGLILFLHLFSIVFLDEDLPEDKANSYGWLLIIIVGFYILANWILIVTITLRQLRQQFKDNKHQKEIAKQKAQEDVEYKKWKKKKQIRLRLNKEQNKFVMIEQLEEATNIRNSMNSIDNYGGGNYYRGSSYTNTYQLDQSYGTIPIDSPGLFHNPENFTQMQLERGQHTGFKLYHNEPCETYQSNFTERSFMSNSKRELKRDFSSNSRSGEFNILDTSPQAKLLRPASKFFIRQASDQEHSSNDNSISANSNNPSGNELSGKSSQDKDNEEESSKIMENANRDLNLQAPSMMNVQQFMVIEQPSPNQQDPQLPSLGNRKQDYTQTDYEQDSVNSN